MSKPYQIAYYDAWHLGLGIRIEDQNRGLGLGIPNGDYGKGIGDWNLGMSTQEFKREMMIWIKNFG